MVKRIIKYLFFGLLLLFGVIIILMVYPNGDLRAQLHNSNVPALGYAIIENGKVVETKVIGELENGVDAPPDAIFNVASVTKPVFATMVMKLVDQEVLDLDEPVYPYWIDPDIAADERHKTLTPRMFLSHQSGFPNWRWHNEDGKLSFWHDPGTTYQYSGEGMEYLKKVIENKTGYNLVELMDSLVFEPIGMKDSRLVWDSLLHETRLAKFHDNKKNIYDLRIRRHAVASDDLCTTIQDMSKFAQFVMNESSGLSRENYEDMVTIHNPITDRSGYGLGWQVVPNLPNGEYALVHGGSDQGVRARIVILPKSKSAFIAVVNGDAGQPIIDRLMVNRLTLGSDIISKIYAPVIWRIIYLPFQI